MENDINNHNICVVGAGNWGRNHIRTLHQLNSLGAVVENDPQAIRFIKEEYPYCNIHTDLISSLNKDYDGFIVATPPLTHFEIAKKIIESNKPLLVEKPLTLNVNDAIKSRCISLRIPSPHKYEKYIYILRHLKEYPINHFLLEKDWIIEISFISSLDKILAASSILL